MSYVAAPTFGGNFMGVRRLRSVSGLGRYYGMRGLGDTQGDADAAVAAGLLDSGTASLLISEGATDQDFINLLNGAMDLPTLMLKYAGAPGYSTPATSALFSSSSQPAAPLTQINPDVAPPPPVSAPSGVATSTATGSQPAAAQSPPGSRFIYQVTYSQNISTPAPNGFIASMTSALPAYGMSVASSNLISNTALGLGSATISFTISDNVGHALLSQAQSVLDALSNQFTYNSKTGSQIGGLVAASMAVPAAVILPAAAATSVTTVLEQWGPWIGLGFAAFLIAGIVFEKRF